MGVAKNKRKSGPQQQPLLPPNVAEDEIEVSDEDFDFLSKNKRYAGFLNQLDTKTITKEVVGLKDDAQDEEALESFFERRVKKSRLKEEEKEKKSLLSLDPASVLPVKTLSGELYYKTDSKASDSLHQNDEGVINESFVKDGRSKGKLTKVERRIEMKKEKRKAKNQATSIDQPAKLNEEPKPSALEELKNDISAAESFAERKEHIAEIGINLLSDPESNITKLKELMALCCDEDEKVANLALLSLAAIFKDIVPGYRVRLPTEKESQMKVSKDVKKLRDYEAALLRSYQVYLQKLIELSEDSSLQQTSVRCLCVLLEAIPHFNYRESLLGAVVPHMASVDDLNRKLSCGAVRSLFLNEGKHRGEATVDAVRLIADLVKHNNCYLHPDAIDVFMSLSFDEDLGQQHEKKDNGKNKRDKSHGLLKNDNKAKKHQLAVQLREEVESDLKAAFSAPDSSEKRKMQTRTLATVFEIYFRILKCTLQLQDRHSLSSSQEHLHIGYGQHPLLVSCLDGLGKFSHLIDVDFMGDLFGLLQKLAAGRSNDKTNGSSFDLYLTVPERLRCCIVAFKILRSNLDALNVDLRQFYVELYNILLECDPARDDQGQALAEALQIMLCEGRQHDTQRVAAFVKRLATLSLQFGPIEALTALTAVQNLLQKYSKCRSLLENDSGGGSVGGLVAMYRPEASEPELSGALSSILWELAVLSNHYHPAVSSLANNIANIGTSQNQLFISSSPLEVLKSYSTAGNFYNPPHFPIHTRKQINKRAVNHSKSTVTNLYHGIDFNASKEHPEEKFTAHFKLHRAIRKNEKLRQDLNKNLAYLRLYEQYKNDHKKSHSKKARKAV